MKLTKLIWLFLIIIALGLAIGTTFDQVLNRLKLGLDLQGGFEVLYKVEPINKYDDIDEDVLKNTISTLNNRVNVLGVSEPNIQAEGSDRIRVQLAGVKDQASARRMLSTEAHLTFRDINDQLMLDGNEIESAKLSFDQFNKPIVSIKLKDPNKFKGITSDLSNNVYPNNILAIWLDYEEGLNFKDEQQKPKQKQRIISAPQVKETLSDDNVIIEGDFTLKEANELASMLNAGSLPVKLTEIYSQSVGAHFGDDALSKTILAGIIGISLVFLFMVGYYGISGLISTFTLCAYIYMILLIFDWMNGVLTLPGIAALILGVGMAVDANIITFERMKDELALGKSLENAFRAGTRRAFITILDANLTTILVGLVLFTFGTSGVKGFATMLIISILISFLTAVWGSRILLGLLLKSNILKGKVLILGVALKRLEILNVRASQYVTNSKRKLDFVKYRKIFYIISLLIFSIGIFSFFSNGLNLGIDFTSGTRVEVISDNTMDTNKLKKEFRNLNYNPDITISGKKDNIGVAVIKGDINQSEVEKIKDTFKSEYGSEPNVNVVSSIVGKELVKNAIKAIFIASFGIVIYLTIRYELSFALTAVVALFHDALLTVFVFSFLQVEVNLYFIAAVLTIIGYSINDTIVTFDRIKEHLREVKLINSVQELQSIVNISLQQTLSRSINTVLTVLMTAFALYIFGSESISGFSLALLIGLIAGTYSSLFIASQLWFDIKSMKLKNGNIVFYKEKEKYDTDKPLV